MVRLWKVRDMIRKAIVISAVVCYLFVVGCVLIPSGESSGTPAVGVRTYHSSATTRPPIDRSDLPYRGVAMQLQRVDWMDKYKQSLDEISALGADTVSLVVDARQENGVSNRIFLDQRFTPSPEALIDLIKYAKSKKLRVMLMPIVLLDEPRGEEWRGTIKPDSWEKWFESYREMMGQFSWIAQASGVDILVVGSELVSTEDKTEQWTRTIDAIRKVYKGRLTYSSNWDHYKSVTFWDQLDMIGMNSYWSFVRGKWESGKEKEVTPEKIQKRWKEIQDEVLPFVARMNKPLLFTEVGWCSMANMAHEPWDYTRPEYIAATDTNMQRMLYEGFFKSWWGNPNLGGFMMWEWSPGDGGPDDRGYTPENKPAEKLIHEWLAKPWTAPN